MARFIKQLYTGEESPVIEWFAVDASQTINEGDFVQIDATSKLLKPAAAASTTIVGVALGSVITGASPSATKDRIPVALARGGLFRVAYTGSTKTSLATTDKFTTKFDLGTASTVNLDDTTGGMCYVYNYDNTNKTADVVIATANLILS